MLSALTRLKVILPIRKCPSLQISNRAPTQAPRAVKMFPAYFDKRSNTFFVIRITAGSLPLRPCAQSVLPQVKTVPPSV